MASSTGTDRRECGTGQDTPLGVCPCPAPLPATPSGTWRDIVPSCPAVTHWISGVQAKRQPHFCLPWPASVLLELVNQYGDRRSRSKGARTERSIVNALQANGIAEVRVPLSCAAGGHFNGDVVIPLMGRDLCVEAKARADGFRALYSRLNERDVLIVKADRQEPPVVVRLSLASEFAKLIA